MIQSDVTSLGVENFPEVVTHSIGVSKYPFKDMVLGQAIAFGTEEGETIKDIKKRLTSAVKQVERRFGKTADGKKVKGFQIWVATDEESQEESVVVGCNTYNVMTEAPAPDVPATAAASKKKSNKKEG